MMVAAMVLAGASMVSCSKDEAVAGKYKMSIRATKAGNNSKELSLYGNTLNAEWAIDEQVKVYKTVAEEEIYLGTLTAQGEGYSTTLDGEIEGEINENDVLTLKFCSSNYDSQNGTLEYIASHCDYAVATVTVSSTLDGHIETEQNFVEFENKQAIVKFILKDNTGSAINPTKLVVRCGADKYTITPEQGVNSNTNVMFVALPDVTNKTVSLCATRGNDIFYFRKPELVTLANGQYYVIDVKMSPYEPTPSEVFTEGTEVCVTINTDHPGETYSIKGTYINDSYQYVVASSSDANHNHQGVTGTMTKDGNNLVVYIHGAFNDATVTFNTDNSNYIESMTSNNENSIYRMTSLASIAVNDVDITSQLTNATPPQEVTITWNSSFILNNIDLSPDGDDFVSQDGIKASYNGDVDFFYGDLETYSSDSKLTFTSTVGNISKVEIYYTDIAGHIPGGQGWTDDGTKVTWEGTPAPSVTLAGNNISIYTISQIVFTIQPIQQ